MGFFDVYEDEGGDAEGTYVTKALKRELIENGSVIVISAIEFQPEKGYKKSDRYLLTVTSDAFEGEKGLGFGTGSVDSRDRMLAAMAEYLDNNPGETVSVVIESVGENGAQIIVPA